MLSFFKSPAKQPKSLVIDEKQDDGAVAVTIESTDASSALQPTDEAEARLSSASMPTIDSTPTIQGKPADAPLQHPPDSPNPTASLAPPSPVNAQVSPPSVHTQSSTHGDHPMHTQSQSALPYSPPDANSPAKDPRRFSFPSFSFLRSDAKQPKSRPKLPPIQTQFASVSKASEKKPKSGRPFFVFIGSTASSEKRAKESAVIVRSVIVGDPNVPPVKTKAAFKHDVARVKSQLLDPKVAAKVITQLRALPPHPNDVAPNTNVPIHAVCLAVSDRDVHEQYFARLESIATSSMSAISTALADVHLVDLLMAPNMGFGAPVTAQGLFAGSVPTPETVIDGVEQITPQLMALGYATGKVMLPDHDGVTVPSDRISVLTYWWGFEICLPSPTVAYLEAAEFPGSALLDLLTALSVLNEGVREILPFIRYIAQFVQTEWRMIKGADQGKGVICTATWLLPVALVPRAWDFPDPPPPHSEMGVAPQSAPTSPSVKRFSATLTTPKPSTEAPGGAPRVSSAYSTETRDEEDSRHIISSDPPVLPELVVSAPGSIDGAPPKNVDGETHNSYDKAQHDGGATAH